MISITPEEFAKQISAWIEEKNGFDTVLMDVTEKTTIANYFVIASGNSERQVKAIADHIELEAKKLDIFPKGVEGRRESRWILIDYFDVIVHIFQADERERYDLEALWKENTIKKQEA